MKGVIKMKRFEEPNFGVEKLDVVDVITTSGGDINEGPSTDDEGA